MSTVFYVYNGGDLYGSGRWSGPHATRQEAEESRLECARVVGGQPFVLECLA